MPNGETNWRAGRGGKVVFVLPMRQRELRPLGQWLLRRAEVASGASPGAGVKGLAALGLGPESAPAAASI